MLTADRARMLNLYVGTGKPRWMERAHGVPLFISASVLDRYRRRGDDMPHAQTTWALDSGGFTELQRYGTWRTCSDTYGGMVTRFIDECGWQPDWCAPQDWMCEDAVINGGTFNGVTFAGTKLSVPIHQELTVENLCYLRREFSFVPWIPVLQGKTLADYIRCDDMYRAAGVDLRNEPLVGLGSVCRRQATNEIATIVETMWGRGIRRMHGFGVKTDGLAKYGRYLVSADSQAWSATARRERFQLDGCDHPGGDCRNCMRWAMTWREQVLAQVAAAPDHEQGALDLFPVGA